MSDRLALLLEAERRGILPPDKAEALNEARRRGLVPTQAQESPQAQPERSIGDSLGRAAGLTARYGIEGLASVPGIVLDPLTTLAGRGRWTDALSRTLTDWGLPQPEDEGEKVSGAIAKGIAGAGPLVKGAQALAAGAGFVPSAVRSIAGAPATEAISQGVGAGASESVRESGGPEWAALLAGVASPMALQVGAGGVKMAAQGINELRRPLTRGGAEQIAADTLGRLTQDKTAALQNLQRYAAAKAAERGGGAPVGVPGSRPTDASVAADYGLTTGEQQMARNATTQPLFAQRMADNNAARLQDLEKLGATEARIADFVKKRDDITAPLRDAAFANTRGPVDYGRVRDQINRLRKTPEGGRQETGRALDALDAWIVERQATGRYSPKDAYELHKDIGDLVAGKIADDKGVVRLAAGMAASVKRELATEIEKSAPGFTKYLTTYSKLSKPIDRLQVISDKLGGAGLSRVANSAISTSGGEAAYTLSQNKMRNAVENISKETRPTQRQSEVLGRVLGDLNAENLALRGGKMPGSDTYQNIAAANFVSRMLGDTIAQSGVGGLLSKSVGFPLRPFESRISDMITKAYLDPEEMARLLAMARTSRAGPSIAGAGNYLTPSALGGLLGSFQ